MWKFYAHPMTSKILRQWFLILHPLVILMQFSFYSWPNVGLNFQHISHQHGIGSMFVDDVSSNLVAFMQLMFLGKVYLFPVQRPAILLWHLFVFNLTCYFQSPYFTTHDFPQPKSFALISLYFFFYFFFISKETGGVALRHVFIENRKVLLFSHICHGSSLRVKRCGCNKYGFHDE